MLDLQILTTFPLFEGRKKNSENFSMPMIDPTMITFSFFFSTRSPGFAFLPPSYLADFARWSQYPANHGTAHGRWYVNPRGASHGHAPILDQDPRSEVLGLPFHTLVLDQGMECSRLSALLLRTTTLQVGIAMWQYRVLGNASFNAAAVLNIVLFISCP